MRWRLRMMAAAPLAAVLLAACGDRLNGPAHQGAAGRVDVVSGSGQSATVMAPLPAFTVVRVIGTDGKPVVGAAVNFHATTGGGSFDPGTAVSDERGHAWARWTLGPVAGTQTADARVTENRTGAELVGHLTATAAPGPAAAFAAVDSTQRAGGATAALADSLAVRVADAHGNGIAGVAVSWSAGDGGRISPAASTTNADGVARAQWTLAPVAGMQTALAEAAGFAPVSFVATAGVPPGSTLSIVSGNGQTGTVTTELAEPLVVELRAPDGRPLAGAAVEWVALDGCAVWYLPSPPTATAITSERTDSSGRASATVVLGSCAGPLRVVARADGAAPDTLAATKRPGTPVFVLEAQELHDWWRKGAPGSALPLRATVVDGYGNGLPGAPVQWTVTSGGGSAPEQTLADSAGVARADWILGPARDQALRITTGSFTVTSVAFAIWPDITIVTPLAGSIVSARELLVSLQIFGLTVCPYGCGDGRYPTANTQATVTLSVDDRSLSFRSRGAYYNDGGLTGSDSYGLDIGGLPAGSKTLTITVDDDVGNHVVRTVPFTYAPQ